MARGRMRLERKREAQANSKHAAIASATIPAANDLAFAGNWKAIRIEPWELRPHCIAEARWEPTHRPAVDCHANGHRVTIGACRADLGGHLAVVAELTPTARQRG
jgi:hypothetical protein